MATLNANIGLKRISSSTPGWIAFNTYAARNSLRAVLARFDEITAALESATVPAVRYALQPIFQTSQMLCPVKTGAMKASGYLDITRISRTQVHAELGYAKGGRPSYTALQHENLDYHHKPPTSAKWLQRAMEQHLAEIPERLASKLRPVIK